VPANVLRARDHLPVKAVPSPASSQNLAKLIPETTARGRKWRAAARARVEWLVDHAGVEPGAAARTLNVLHDDPSIRAIRALYVGYDFGAAEAPAATVRPTAPSAQSSASVCRAA
jgi:hypothetical protein